MLPDVLPCRKMVQAESPTLEPVPLIPRPNRRHSRIVVLIVLIVIIAVVVGALESFYVAPPATRLQVSVSPNAIPKSGSWLVTSSIFYPSNGTGYDVDSTIVMTATLADGTKNVQSKTTTAGQASFSVPSNTVAVRFDATYQMYSGSTTVSGPAVIAESGAEIAIYGAIGAGPTLATAAWLWERGKKNGIRRALSVVPGLIVSVPPIAYVVQNFPTWYGTGWMPASYWGIPMWGFTLLSIGGGAVAAAFEKTASKPSSGKAGPP